MSRAQPHQPATLADLQALIDTFTVICNQHRSLPHLAAPATIYHALPKALPAEQWRPELGAQLVAAFFSLALLVTVEVLARVPWPSGRNWGAARFGGAGVVALVAAVVSYLHPHGLLVAYGEDVVTAPLGPLAADGLMVVCGFALLAISRVSAATWQRPATGADGKKGGAVCAYLWRREGRPHYGRPWRGRGSRCP